MVNVPGNSGSSGEIVRTIRKTLIMILPVIAFVPPLLILYLLYPASFEETWRGRTFYLFFLWLVTLEIILNWDKVQRPKVNKTISVRTAAFIAFLLLPTIYTVAANYFGMNGAIVNWGTHVADYFGLSHANLGFVPLSTEYLVLTALFVLIVCLEFGIGQLKESALSALFLAAIGIIFTIDNFYPYGQFTLFQIPVPITTQLAANIFDLMGYHTAVTQTFSKEYGSISSLYVFNPKRPLNQPFNPQTLGIAWPCAGVESLIIYTVTILIFLKGSAFSLKRRTIYFAVGAIVTYFINVLRIVTIFIIATQYGADPNPSSQFSEFHNFYGQLYSITWIMVYPLIIIGSQFLWNKVKAGTNGRILPDTSDCNLS